MLPNSLGFLPSFCVAKWVFLKPLEIRKFYIQHKTELGRDSRVYPPLEPLGSDF